MKTLLAFIFVFSFGFTFAQSDTTQYKIDNRQNGVQSKDKPYVILISADGFRNDYARKYNAENLLKLAQNGVEAKGMYPSFPSNTFPNHYTLVTGMYPSTHGLVDNSFYDPKRDETYTMGNKTMVADSSWYGGLPLWGLAEKNNLLAASLFWVSSESNVAGVSPTYYYKYHNEFSNQRKIEIVKSWLQLPEAERPHLITLYFPEVDSKGHYHGPDAKETEEAVLAVDKAIGQLVNEVSKLNLPDVNYIFVSDHGMLLSDLENTLTIPDIVNNKRFVVINSFSSVRISALNEGDILPVFKQLKKQAKGKYKVYLIKKTPKRWHFRENKDERLGDILLLPPKGKIFQNPVFKRPYPGAHGYDPKKVKEMKATFMAWGPAFKSCMKIPAFENVHVYPLVAKVLGLPITHEIDGKEKVLNKILVK